MPNSIGICTRSKRVLIPDRRYTIARLYTRGRLGADVVPMHTPYFRPRIVGRAPLLLLLLRVCAREA